MVALWIAPPSQAFLFLIAGMLAVYGELIRPGRIFPGLLGLALTGLGTYFLWLNVPTGIGLALLTLAVALFAAEAIWRVHFAFGIFGTIALLFSSWLLFDTPHRIAPSLGVPLCLSFGAVTVFLSWAAKRGRRNKRMDIGPGE